MAGTFYNFNPEAIARTIPRAWTQATPEQVLQERLTKTEDPHPVLWHAVTLLRERQRGDGPTLID